jgi:hypothetical protein
MNPLQEKRRALGHQRACFGGDSSTASTTNIYDKRVVGGDGSTNVSADVSGGSLTVVQTDQGAVSGGLALGGQAVDAATKLATNTQAQSGSMFKEALGFARANSADALSAVSDSNERLALAYQSGQAGDQTQLKYAGFAVVGLAALAFIGSRIK